MPEIQLFIDNYLEYGSISIDSEKNSASNPIIYIPAKLHLGHIKRSFGEQHFNIEVIQCNLSLLGNFKKLKAADIFNPYSSENPNQEPDITFEFSLSRSDIEDIENERKGSDVNLELYANFHLEISHLPGSKIKGKRVSSAHINGLKISGSQWEDTILPAFWYSKEYLRNEPEKKKIISILSKAIKFLKENWDKIIQLLLAYFVKKD